MIDKVGTKLIIGGGNLDHIVSLCRDLSGSHVNAGSNKRTAVVKTWADSQNRLTKQEEAPGTLPVAQSEARGDHLGEIEAHALEEIRLQRHCNKREEGHIVTRHRLDWRSSQSTDQTR